MEPESIAQQKDVEFYAASVNAWYSSALEHDKSLFSLSAGGIGLLITLLTTIGISSWIVLWLYAAALLAFIACLTSILMVFSNNKKHIEMIINNGPDVEDPLLKNLDNISLISFGIGAVLSAAIGISSAATSFNKQESKMATNSDSKKPATTPTKTRGYAQDSYQGVASLQKSFTGAGKLQPQPVASAPAPAPAAPNQTSANNASTSKK